MSYDICVHIFIDTCSVTDWLSRLTASAPPFAAVSVLHGVIAHVNMDTLCVCVCVLNRHWALFPYHRYIDMNDSSEKHAFFTEGGLIESFLTRCSNDHLKLNISKTSDLCSTVCDAKKLKILQCSCGQAQNNWHISREGVQEECP